MWLVLVAIAIILIFVVINWKLAPPPSIARVHTPGWMFYKDFFFRRISLDDRRKLYPELKNNDLTRFFFFGRWQINVSNPDMAKEIYTDMETYPKFLAAKENPNLVGSRFFGINLVFSNGSEWRKQHKIISPAFQTKNLVKISNKVFHDCISLLFDKKWEQVNEEAVEIHKWTQRLTLDVLGRAAFSFDLGSIEDENAKYVTLYNEIVRSLFKPLLVLFPIVQTLPFPSLTLLKSKIEDFDQLLYSVIEARKKQKAETTSESEHTEDSAVDLLDLLLCSSDITTKELRDNFVIFFLAGHDTTANALSICCYFLAKFPQLQEKARREATEIYQKTAHSKITDYIPSYEDQKGMDFITACIKETLRLYPSVAILPARKTARETTLGDITVPKDTLISVSIFDMQRNSKVWGPDSEDFIPERFLPPEHPLCTSLASQPTRNDHPIAFNAFGASHRSCIGQQFSMIEQRMFLSTLLLRYDLSFPEGFQGLEMVPGALLAPKNLHIILKRRSY